MKTVNEILLEKGVNENFLLNTVETLAVVMRGNTLSGAVIPASLRIEGASTDTDEEFRKEVEFLLNNRGVALQSIVIGLDTFAGFFFNELHTGGYTQITEEGMKVLEGLSEEELVNAMVAPIAAVMAALEKRMADQSPRYAKLDWGYDEISTIALEYADSSVKKLQEVVNSEAAEGLDPIQIKVTSILSAVMSIMSIHALVEVSKMLQAEPAFVEEISGGASTGALYEIFTQTGAAIVREKLAINFGEEFCEQLQALAERESSQATIQ